MKVRCLFKFSSLKAVRLKEYIVEGVNTESRKNNLLWLHGLFDSSKNFLNLAKNEELQKITSSYLLDARNHGLSEHAQTNTFADMSYDLISYIANSDMKDIYLIGHSMGGRTIMTAMRDHK